MMQRLYPLARKTKSFIRINYKDKLLLSEAFFLSGIARMVILIIPFKNMRAYMGTYNSESPFQVESEKYFFVKRVIWAIRKSSEYTPWESKCLVQALTVQRMLKRRNIYSTIYLGVNKDETNKLIAHSWLRVGEVIVTGGNVMRDFKEVAKFSNYKEDIFNG